MNFKKPLSNEAYYSDQMKILWIKYGHDPDIPDFQVSSKDEE